MSSPLSSPSPTPQHDVEELEMNLSSLTTPSPPGSDQDPLTLSGRESPDQGILNLMQEVNKTFREKLLEEIKVSLQTVENNLRSEFNLKLNGLCNKSDEMVEKMDKLFLKNVNDVNMSLKEELRNRDIEQQKLKQELEEKVSEIALLKKKLEESKNEIKSLLSAKNDNAVKSKAKTLILGDMSLTNVSSWDLNYKNCSVRTIRDGKLDSMQSWVTDELNFPLNKCFIYGGLQDIGDECNTESLLDKLGRLVAALKSKNEDLNVMICELIPSPVSSKEHISVYNSKIKEWCESNGVTFFPTNLSFSLGTGEIDPNCFYQLPNKDHNLNRTGAIRLLDAFNKFIPNLLREDWDNVKSRSLRQSNGSGSFSADYYYDQPHTFNSAGWEEISNRNNTNSYSGALKGGRRNQTARREDHQHRNQNTPRDNYNNQNDYYRPLHNSYRNVRREVGCYSCGRHDHHRNMCQFR